MRLSVLNVRLGVGTLVLCAGGRHRGAAWRSYRFLAGIGAVSNLNQGYPWGFWIGFDVLAGIALAAGGFVVAGLMHMFGGEKYHPLVRPTILTAFLGYLLFIVALLVDLGRPWTIWHMIDLLAPRIPDVRGRLVRDDVHDDPLPGVPSGGVRAVPAGAPVRGSGRTWPRGSPSRCSRSSPSR